MNYFEETHRGAEDRFGTKWYEPGMTLKEAYEVIRAIPIDKEFGEENPKQPRQNGLWAHLQYGHTFIQIRLRELFEGYKVSHGDPYYIGMMGQRAFERDFLLWHDAELREELIWPLFSLYGTRNASFALVESYPDEGWTEDFHGWAAPLVALVDEGLLDRQRLLDEMLKALNRGFPTYRVRWFTQHYDDFSPTEEETTVRQHLLLAAMGSGVASTVAFAVKQLSRLSALDQDGFVAAAPHALGASKATGMTALKMLEGISEHRDDLVADIADAAAHGLHHPHDDVVRRSAELLRTLGREDLIKAGSDALNPAMQYELLGSTETRGTTANVAPVEVAPADAQPVKPWSDEDALFRTRELLADRDPVESMLFVAWLAETGPRALEILAPLVPPELHIDYPKVQFVLRLCIESPARMERFFTPARRNAAWDSLLRVVSIVRGESPTRILLSTPTDTFGRVDNAEFERRLRTYESREDVWTDDATLAQLRLMQFAEDPLGTGIAAGVQVAPVRRWTGREEDTQRLEPCIWWRTAQGWVAEEGAFDPFLPDIDGSPFTVWDFGIAPAFVAPTCLDAFIYEHLLDMEWALVDTGLFGDAQRIDVLNWHPGEWSPLTTKFLGTAMSHVDPKARAVTAELVATRLPASADAEAAAKQWAQIEGIKLSRWAKSLSDAATLNPVYIRDLLAFLLPQLDRKSRDISQIIELLRNLRLQTGQREIDKQLHRWLSEYEGKTKAAAAAAAILKEAK